jgi:diguanylate cyclase (GGDEF)-like protein
LRRMALAKPKDELILTKSALPDPNRAKRRTRRLVFSALTVVIVGAIGAGVLLSHLYIRTMQDAEREQNNLSLVLATYTENTFRSVELLQNSLVEMVQDLDLTSTEQFTAALSSRDIYLELKNRALALPLVDALFLTNADGVTVSSTRAWPVPKFSIADRPHFYVLRDNKDMQSYLAPPSANVQTGTWNMYLARRLETAQGEFLGIVGVGLSLEQYEEFLGRIVLGQHGSIALWRHDGVLIARHPRLLGERNHMSSAVREHFSEIQEQGGHRVSRRISSIDNQERLIAERVLNGYPAEVTVTRSLVDILRQWRRQVVFTMAGLLVLIVGAFGAVRIGTHMLRNRDTMEQMRIDLRLSEEMRRSEAQIAHLAHHDSLTGLANRLLLRDRLDDAIARTHRGELCALLCIDLDHFKEVNDTLGHPVGDRLLQAVSKRILAEVREHDTVARLGGDEFVVLQSVLKHPQDAAMLAQRLVESLGAPFDIEGHHLVIGASVGIAVAPNDGADQDILMRNSDLALYRAKQAGRGGYRFFEPEMNFYVQMRRSLQMDLRRAIEVGEFELFHQAQVSMATRQITGFEALLRWHQPERGLLLPDRFIHVAEETGLIVPIGGWALLQACITAAGWHGGERIAVNLSPVQFSHARLVHTVASALEASGLAPARLELEITETVMLRDTEATLATMHQLKALGVSIALDDFGTGYSSLAYLQRFPFDKVKIDKGFVREIEKDTPSEAIVRAIVGLCTALKMTTIAEGVETDDQFQLLSDLGCTEAQGYLFGKPCPESQIVWSPGELLAG